MNDWVNYIDGLANISKPARRLNGTTEKGTGTFVSYSFVEYDEITNSKLHPMSQAQRASVRKALDVYEASSGLRFVEVSAEMKAAGVEAQLSFRQKEMRAGGTGGAPYVTEDRIDNKFVTLKYGIGAARPGSSAYTILLHELGHATGLKHPHQGANRLPEIYDNFDYTIMSYNGQSRWVFDIKVMDKYVMELYYGASRQMADVTYGFQGTVFTATGGVGDDNFIGVNAQNRIQGNDGNDFLAGRLHNDTIHGGNGNDTLDGSNGNDMLFGDQGDDVLRGGKGNDVLIGGDGNDELHGNAGNDQISAMAGDDFILAGDGADLVIAGDGNDVIDAGAGDDLVAGGAGDDFIFTSTGNDTVYGNNGNDTIDGGSGNTTLIGGAGADTFIISAQSTPTEHSVQDYEIGQDKIKIDFSNGFALFHALKVGDDTHLIMNDTTKMIIENTTWSDLNFEFDFGF